VARSGAARDRVPVLPRALGGGDGGGAGCPARNGQVADGTGARASARGGRRVSLERDLRALAAELEWPDTPALAPLELGRRRNLRPLVLALAVLVLALAVAFAVPPARSAILRFLHLRGVSVERVETLPPAEERPLVAGL